MKNKFFGFLTLLPIVLFVLHVHPVTASSISLTYGKASLNRSCGSIYTVRAGDTLSAIAARCGVSLSSLISANGLRITSIIYPGQRLAIPGANPTTLQSPTGATTTYTSCTNPYTVRAGDTLSSIAARCGLSVYTLKQSNGLSSDMIRVGQALYLRGAVQVAPAAVATPYPYYYAGVTATATPAPYIAPAIVDYLAPLPTPTPRIESPISPWW